MKIVRRGYLHEVPDDEPDKHNTTDGEWCWCAPRVRDLPLAIADAEGYARVVLHASSTERAARATRLA